MLTRAEKKKKEHMLRLIKRRMHDIGMYSGHDFALSLYHVWTSGQVLVYRKGTGKLVAFPETMKSADMIDIIYSNAPKP